MFGAMQTRRTALPTEMFARPAVLQQLFRELSLAHSSNMDVAISKFAFAFVAAKGRVKHPSIERRDNNDYGPARQWTDFGTAKTVG